MSRHYYGWKMLPFLWLAYGVGLGFPFFAGSVINTAMAEVMQLDRKTLGAMAAAYSIIAAIGHLPIAAFSGRFGSRNTILLGAAIMVTATVWLSLASTTMQAMLAFSLLSLCPPAVVMGTQTNAAKWFVQRRGTALAIIATATALGGMVFAPLVGATIEKTGMWQNGWRIGVGLGTFIFLTTLIFVRESPESIGRFADGASSAEEVSAAKERVYRSRLDWPLSAAMATRVFWLVLLMLVAVGLSQTLYLAHVVAHLKDLGHSPTTAAIGIAGIGLGMFPGKILAGFLADRMEARPIYAAALVFMGISFAILMKASTLAMLFLAVGTFGVSYGAAAVMVPTILTRYFGVKPFPMLFSVAQLVAFPLAGGWAYLSGAWFDAGYSYAYGFLGSGLICLVTGTAFYFWGYPPKSGSSAHPMRLQPQTSEVS